MGSLATLRTEAGRWHRRFARLDAALQSLHDAHGTLVASALSGLLERAAARAGVVGSEVVRAESGDDVATDLAAASAQLRERGSGGTQDAVLDALVALVPSLLADPVRFQLTEDDVPVVVAEFQAYVECRVPTQRRLLSDATVRAWAQLVSQARRTADPLQRLQSEMTLAQALRGVFSLAIGSQRLGLERLDDARAVTLAAMLGESALSEGLAAV